MPSRVVTAKHPATVPVTAVDMAAPATAANKAKSGDNNDMSSRSHSSDTPTNAAAVSAVDVLHRDALHSLLAFLPAADLVRCSRVRGSAR
jgi:hypothetical protein